MDGVRDERGARAWSWGRSFPHPRTRLGSITASTYLNCRQS